MRIVLFSEALTPPFDEGIKNVAHSLLVALRKRHDVLALTNKGPKPPAPGIERLPANRLLWSHRLRWRIDGFRPELVVYLPTACATPLSFVRTWLLHYYGRRAPTAMVALQPRTYRRAARMLIPRLAVGPVWAQGRRTAEPLRELGVPVLRLPPAVDTDRFRPADVAEKVALRSRYGLATDRPVLLHVGHLNPNRNVPALTGLRAVSDAQVVLVGSTSTPADEATVEALRAAGVRVIAEVQPTIEDLYRLADAYVFPVRSDTGCIDAPLSVLEAMACGLPVVSTRYDALPRLFPDAAGVYYYEGEDELRRQAARALADGAPDNRRLVLGMTWDAAAEALVEGSLGGEERTGWTASE